MQTGDGLVTANQPQPEEAVSVVRCKKCGFIAGEVDPFGDWRSSGCTKGGEREHGPTETISMVPSSQLEALREALREIDQLAMWFFSRTDADIHMGEFAVRWGQLGYHGLLGGSRMDGIYQGRVSRFDPGTGRTSSHAELVDPATLDQQGEGDE